MEIKELSNFNPLFENPSWESGYTKVLGLKELTFTTHCDIALDLTVIFSINGTDQGHTHTFRCLDWSSRNIRVTLPWCKVRLSKPNDSLLKSNNICVLSVLSNKEIKHETV